MYASGADIASRDASERIIIGGQEQVSMDGWNDHPDYLTCGHIHKRQHIWNTNWARYTGSVLPMSFAEKDYTHGVDLVTLTAGHRPVVEQLDYTPQHRLRVMPEDGADLTVNQLTRLINNELQERTNDKLDDHFDYVWLKVRRKRVNNDDSLIFGRSRTWTRLGARKRTGFCWSFQDSYRTRNQSMLAIRSSWV